MGSCCLLAAPTEDLVHQFGKMRCYWSEGVLSKSVTKPYSILRGEREEESKLFTVYVRPKSTCETNQVYMWSSIYRKRQYFRLVQNKRERERERERFCPTVTNISKG
ncbi:hypothetical protein GOP47_0010942 [Adiantum capillus-veneris]|uniref:Uncharacterized protein n=1 Tax=Adiantum capillus-veneris TaxID=13818 RepID=A0A9D4ZJ73_ADICA|nr:hypothetical protein GOP47_0010942 [Adiantum capillus-veneris]